MHVFNHVDTKSHVCQLYHFSFPLLFGEVTYIEWAGAAKIVFRPLTPNPFRESFLTFSQNKKGNALKLSTGSRCVGAFCCHRIKPQCFAFIIYTDALKHVSILPFLSLAVVVVALVIVVVVVILVLILVVIVVTVVLCLL